MLENGTVATKKQNVSMVDFVIEIIKGWVAQNVYQCGDKLPSESELVAQTGASRSSVREAMKILSTIGLVQIKRGNGTYISEHADQVVWPIASVRQKTQWSLRELSESREMIERAAVEIIILSAKEEQIYALEQANNQLLDAVERELEQEEQFQRDLAFHKQLGASTQNPLMEELYDYMMEVVKDYIHEDYQQFPSMGYVSYLMHQRMIDAIRYRDFELARQAVVDATHNFVKPRDLQDKE